ncbi:cytochrome P450 [Musa troglodytarum]|uniref:Cytochrome P450 n=1 Tax=Musa troglodytarum TaxID=320322 RepID=A0A9E7GCS4_9LILI|nr:cytochrome P450 [Musa troglodytarum]
MDFTNSAFLFSTLLFLFLLQLLKKNSSSRRASARLPPGPSNLPIIGSLHHLLGALPHHCFAALSKKFGPVMLLKLGEVPTLVVSSPDAAAEIMKTHDISFASRPTNLTLQSFTYGDTGIGFASYGSRWRELRKMSILQLLSAKRVQSFRFIREEEVLNLVQSILLLSNTGSAVNLSRKFVLLSNDIAARSIIGSKCKYQKEFLRILTQALEAAGGFSLADLFPAWPIIKVLSGMSSKLQRLHQEIDAILNSIIQEHKERKSAEQLEEDLLDVMLRVQAEGALSFPLADEYVKAIILDLLGGGGETSATILEWAMSELMRNPRVMGARGGEGDCRRKGKGDRGRHQRNELPETGNQGDTEAAPSGSSAAPPRVPGGERGSWLPEFEPERFEGRSSMVDFKGTNFEFLPFGAGRRMCPGMSFGLASLETSLASLLYHFDWEFPTRDEQKPIELDMSETFLLTCRRRSELCLRAILGFLCNPTTSSSLHHLLNALPHHSLTALSKKFGPVILLKLGELPTLVVSSAEAAAEIMKTHDISFASRPTNLTIQAATYGDRGIGFTSYGFHWRELRKMSIVELLSAKRVQSFRFIREEEVHNLVQSIVLLSDTGSTVNLSGKFALLANDIAARSIIGSKCKYQKDFLRIVTQTLEAAGGFSLADLFPSWPIIKLLSGASSKMQRLHREMDAILNSIIQEHKERKSEDQPEEEEDLVDVMLRVQAEGSLSFPFADEYVKAIMLDMLGGGSETSATILEWAMSELMRNPRVMRRVQEEVRETVGGKGKVTENDINGMNYLRLVIKETLRLHPPVPLLLPRECREACEVLGYQIPEKTRVFVNVWALGRDPRYWDNATEFEPERFERRNSVVDFKGTNFEFLPFGAGRRMCPGMSFGLAGIELSLACLLYNFDWELPTGDEGKPHELDMSETFLLTCRRKSDLCLRAIPRIPFSMT